MTKELATQLLDLMDGLCETEQGRLAVAVLRYIATGEKKEPRGTERAFYRKACELVDAHDVHLHNINNKSKDILSQVTSNNSSNIASFDIFWNAYPVKVNKKRCAEIWKKINLDDELLQKMLDSIESWKKSRQWQQGYVPNPDTWLRGEKWNDADPEPWNQKKKHFANEREPMSYDEFMALVVNLDELEV